MRFWSRLSPSSIIPNPIHPRPCPCSLPVPASSTSSLSHRVPPFPAISLLTGHHCKASLTTSPATIASPHSRCISEALCVELLSLCNLRSQPQPQGICVHSPIIKLGLQCHLFLANNLVVFYSRCCGLDQALKLFDEMPHRDAVSWTAIISAYSWSGKHEEALQLFQKMRMTRLNPNEFTFSTVLRCASSLKALHLGARSHAQIIKCGFGSNVVLATALVDFYSKCHALEDAFQMFPLMVDGDAITWTTMISARVQAGDWIGAIQLYASMIGISRVRPNEFTFTKVLQACGSLGPHFGKLVHTHVIVSGVVLNLVLKTALVHMYSRCHSMEEALKAFTQTPESDTALWTAIISGYAQAEDHNAAIAAFREMEVAGVPPNSFTYAGVLSNCSAVPVPDLGRQLHSRVIKVGLEHDLSIGNALVDLYAKCSPNLVELLHAFEVITYPNVISWTALIAGLTCHGRDDEAVEAFIDMRVAGVQPNSFTLTTILKGCGSPQALPHAKKVHAYVLKSRLECSDVAVGNALVDLYARFGRANDAWRVSQEMPCRDVFTYTSLAKGLNQMGLHRQSLVMITHMQHDENIKMDGFSLASFLSASAGLPSVECGKQLHCHSTKSGLNSWLSVSNGLVDMYGKCGSIGEARKVFIEIQQPNVVSWNGLISGLASNGRFSEALSAFEDMRLVGPQPDGVTSLLVLYACSHGGLVDLGIHYFDSMSEIFNVAPQLDHYVCLVDMLGRAGRLEAAASAVEGMPFEPDDALVYKTLLAACKLHGNLALAESTARCALEIEPSDPAVYVLLAGIYDDAGRPDLGEQTRRMMRERRTRKCPGQSWTMQLQQLGS